MGATCSKCGKPLTKTQLLSYCGECRAVTAVHRPKSRLKYQKAGYLERWLKKLTIGKSAREKGLFLLETQLSMGKTAFFHYLEEQNGQENLSGRFSRQTESLQILYFDCCFPSGECGKRLTEMVAGCCKSLQPRYALPFLTDEAADKSKRFAQMLNSCRQALKSQEADRKLLLIIDHADRGGAGKSALLQYLPEETMLEQGVYVLVAVSTENLEKNAMFRRRLDQLSFTETVSFDRKTLGNTMLVRKVISGRLFALNFRERLTDGDMRIERANGSVKNDFTNLVLLNTLMQARHPGIKTDLDDIPPDTDLAALYFKKLKEVWGQPLFEKMVRWFLWLALLENPVEIGLLAQLNGESGFPEDVLGALGNAPGMLTALQINGKAALSLHNEELAQSVRYLYPEQMERLINEILDQLDRAQLPAGQAPIVAYLAGQVFDLVEQYGTAAQQERVSSEAFLEHFVSQLRSLPEQDENSPLPWSAQVHFFIRAKDYQKLAEAYAFRAECNEKAARYNDAVYDLAAAIQIVERYWESPDRENALVDLYLKRGRIYLSFRKLNSAAEDYTYAISQMTALKAQGHLKDSIGLASLYLQRAELQKKRRQAAYTEEDFGKAISLLEEEPSLSIEGLRTLASAYIGRGIYFGAAGNADQAIEDFGVAVNKLEDWTSQNAAPVLLEQLATAYSARGNAFSRVERYPEAIDELDKAVDLREKLLQQNQLARQTDLSRVYLNRGTAYNAMGEYSHAVEDYTRALQIRSAAGGEEKEKAMDLARAYRNRGVANGKMGDAQAEVEDYTKAIELLLPFATGENRDVILSCSKAYRYREITYRKVGRTDLADEDKTRQNQLQILLNRTFRNGVTA